MVQRTNDFMLAWEASKIIELALAKPFFAVAFLSLILHLINVVSDHTEVFLSLFVNNYYHLHNATL
jgi:hypothetical protein